MRVIEIKTNIKVGKQYVSSQDVNGLSKHDCLVTWRI